MTTDRDLWTVARIADRLGVARHRIEYLIDARDIRPIGTAGIARVFDEKVVELLRAELARIEADRKGVSQ